LPLASFFVLFLSRVISKAANINKLKQQRANRLNLAVMTPEQHEQVKRQAEEKTREKSSASKVYFSSKFLAANLLRASRFMLLSLKSGKIFSSSMYFCANSKLSSCISLKVLSFLCKKD
jgi:hypothetical protein